MTKSETTTTTVTTKEIEIKKLRNNKTTKIKKLCRKIIVQIESTNEHNQ